jgi:hypothetical protein
LFAPPVKPPWRECLAAANGAGRRTNERMCNNRRTLAVRQWRRGARGKRQQSNPSTGSEVGIVRFANIGDREIRKRQILGLVSAVAAGLLGFVLIGYDAPRWARLGVFVPAWLAGLGVFQAREKT